MNPDYPFVLNSPGELARFGVRNAVLAAGVFDGVHQGHRKLLKELLALAEETGSVPCALTFHPHPRTVIAGKNAPPLLVPEEEKYALLHEAGAEYVIVLSFTEEFSRLQPEDFIRRLLQSGEVGIKGICVGASWRFGAGASGTAEDLKRIAEKYCFLFRAVDEFCLPDGRTVCSTLIRKAVMSGDLQSAELMLGRAYALSGTVVHGMGLAGSELGCPTANLQPDAGVLPPCGVYSCRASVPGMFENRSGVMTLGYAPTVRNTGVPEIRIEVHIHDFNGDLYGKRLFVEPGTFLRKEKKFASLEELKQQIAADSEAAYRVR